MKRALLLVLVACFFVNNVRAAAAARYPVTGLIVSIDKPHRAFVASCSEIPGYMKAMLMPITVREPKALEGLKPSMFVDFTLVVEKVAPTPRMFAFTSTKTWRRNRCSFAGWKCWPGSTKPILCQRRLPSGRRCRISRSQIRPGSG